jgi:hypothetical protein
MCVALHVGHLSATGTVRVTPLKVTWTDTPWQIGSSFGFGVVHHALETAARSCEDATTGKPQAPFPVSLYQVMLPDMDWPNGVAADAPLGVAIATTARAAISTTAVMATTAASLAGLKAGNASFLPDPALIGCRAPQRASVTPCRSCGRICPAV